MTRELNWKPTIFSSQERIGLHQHYSVRVTVTIVWEKRQIISQWHTQDISHFNFNIRNKFQTPNKILLTICFLLEINTLWIFVIASNFYHLTWEKIRLKLIWGFSYFITNHMMKKTNYLKKKRQNNGSSILDKTDEGWRRKRRFLAVGWCLISALKYHVIVPTLQSCRFGVVAW